MLTVAALVATVVLSSGPEGEGRLAKYASPLLDLRTTATGDATLRLDTRIDPNRTGRKLD